MREINNLSRYEDGPDWSVERVVVGDRLHILATCYCFECRGIRDEQDFIEHPQHRHFHKCNLPDCEKCSGELAALAAMAAEDAAEQKHRREMAAAWGRWQTPSGGAT